MCRGAGKPERPFPAEPPGGLCRSMSFRARQRRAPAGRSRALPLGDPRHARSNGLAARPVLGTHGAALLASPCVAAAALTPLCAAVLRCAAGSSAC